MFHVRPTLLRRENHRGCKEICRGTMSTRLAEYYNELQRREGLEPVELITEWAQRDTDAISAAFRTAVAVSRITEQGIPIRAGSTNQSIGNQVADFFVSIINQHLQQYR